MPQTNKILTQSLTENFFRNEYGKMVSVITRYLGAQNVQMAEDIVQETLVKAVNHWQHNGIPENPQAWLYTTAKNITLNILKRNKLEGKYEDQYKSDNRNTEDIDQLQFAEEGISDEQLKMMFVSCHPSISDKSQIALILKILCGFSISEIANAFFTSNETINKRLVRGRKQLRDQNVVFDLPSDINKRLPIVLKTIFLVFNEGYSPTQVNQLLRYDLCLEAIRMTDILVSSEAIIDKTDGHALLALMYFNAARFDARMNESNLIIEMEYQNRKSWNQDLINKGIHQLNLAAQGDHISIYMILATISANHCIATCYEETDWVEILSLYDSLIALEDTPIARLNRSVAIAKVKGNQMAISELENLAKDKAMNDNHLLHSTLAEFYKLANASDSAKASYKKAISLSKNERDTKLLQKRLSELVPI